MVCIERSASAWYWRVPSDFQAMSASVTARVMRAGSAQTRYVPVGPVIVPPSVKPGVDGIVGQPAAGVTSTGATTGGGVTTGGGAGLLIVMLPLVPGDATSSAPHAESTAAETPASNILRNKVMIAPLVCPAVPA